MHKTSSRQLNCSRDVLSWVRVALDVSRLAFAVVQLLVRR